MTTHGQERRRHKRLKVKCPVSFLTHGGEVVAKGRSLDLSDGGTLVSVPARAIDKLKGTVNLTFSVPRCTDNTYMLEDFACEAHVVRSQPRAAKKTAGIAIAFTTPLHLALEV